MLTKGQIEKILLDLEELNSILDDNLTQKKDEAINRIDEMIGLLEMALDEYNN